MRIGTVTDVGTVLIQLRTVEGASRVVCPWELVKITGGDARRDRHVAPQ